MLPADRRPADVRDLQAGRVEPRHRAGQQAEAGGAAELLAALEEQLQAEADAEDRSPRRGPLGDQLVEPGRADPLHRPREGADAGQDQAVGGAHRLGVGADHRPAPRRARAPSRPSAGSPSRSQGQDRGAAPSASRPGAADTLHSLSVPFVEGTPVSSGSIETATRSARAKALNEPSIMWWALVP